MAPSPFGSGSPFAGGPSSADGGRPTSAARGGASLAPRDVRYIALEGGGGKGFAYLGAIEVLESTKPNVLKQLAGVAGTSAGAITALMLAMGLTAAEIKKQTEVDFNTFFDPPQPRLIPQPCY